jgi:hypothetical protein
LQALEETLDASASAPTGGVDPAAAFKARLSALLPRMKEAISAAGPAAQDIKLKAGEAGVFATKKNFDQANRLLDQLEELLANAAGVERDGLKDGKTAREVVKDIWALRVGLQTESRTSATKKPSGPERERSR